MNSPRFAAPLRPLGAALAILACTGAGPSRADEALVVPQAVIADPGLPAPEREALVLAGRRYGTFWNTGDPAYARAALAADFVDETPPPGRAQGPEGPLVASEGFRKAVPDLTCTIEQMIVAGDRVVSHLRFRGHFTGSFEGIRGRGQAIDYRATDIYRVAGGRIAANWHIEDNLTLLRQFGAVAAR